MGKLIISTHIPLDGVIGPDPGAWRWGDLHQWAPRHPLSPRGDLVALLWIGRGDFKPEEWDEARRTAMEEATTPTASYLKGSDHLADHLEAGLEAMGISSTDAEDSALEG